MSVWSRIKSLSMSRRVQCVENETFLLGQRFCKSMQTECERP